MDDVSVGRPSRQGAPPNYEGVSKPPLQPAVMLYVREAPDETQVNMSHTHDQSHAHSQRPTEPPPNNYIAYSLLNICCFWPLGVIALAKSIETSSHYNNGRQVEAEISSREARKYNWWAFGVGLGTNIAVWVFIFVGVILGCTFNTCRRTFS